MHQALYRKWRPKTFDEMVGQDSVRTVLRREVSNHQLSHAYLFCGTRGCGKTTAAKVLAKAVNCLAPEEGNPCNQCEICLGIDEDSIMDVQEIDAASNNGVDSIRAIRDEVQYSPTKAKYRVYIIDEVHMLSQGAFNALLKTLEEPPPHVIFILATTELHKIPATILSRCQSFEFTRISLPHLTGRLHYVAEQEKIVLEPEAAALIARLSDGAMRNALSILDQCAAANSVITEALVSGIAGLAGREYLFDISTAIAQMDGAGGLEGVARACTHAKDTTVICTEILSHFRDILVLKTVEDWKDISISPPSEFEKLEQTAKSITVGKVLECIATLQATLDQMSRSIEKKLALEVSVLSLCSTMLDKTDSSLLRRIESLEKAMAQGERVQTVKRDEMDINVQGNPIQSKNSMQKETVKNLDVPWENEPAEAQRDKEQIAQNAPAKVKTPLAFWSDAVVMANPSVAAFLGQITPQIVDRKLILNVETGFHLKMLQKPSALKEIEEAVFKVTKERYEVVVKDSQTAVEKKPENPLFEKLAETIEKL